MIITKQTDSKSWLDALVAATNETSDQFLGLGDIRVIATTDSLPEMATAGFVSLVGDSSAVQVGIAASADGCQLLAKSLMGMTDEDEDLPHSDVIDALGELANIVAGGVKGRMVDTGETMLLGLPLVLDGTLQVTDRQKVLCAECMIGSIQAHLLVICVS